MGAFQAPKLFNERFDYVRKNRPGIPEAVFTNWRGNGSVLADQPGSGRNQHTVRDRNADHGVMVSDIIA